MYAYKVTIIKDCSVSLSFIKGIVLDYFVDVEVIGEADSIEAGIVEIENNKPDIVFLGVNFQNLIIFDFLDKFNFENIQVIYISSESGFALNAFQSNAADFILTPLNAENVISSLKKAIKKNKIEVCYKENQFPVPIIKNTENDIDIIVVNSLEKIEFLKIEDIIYCASDGNYTTFYLLNGRKVLSTKNIGVYQNLLNPSCFFRIHHSFIINLKHLSGISKKDGLYCELSNNIYLPIAKRRQNEFYKILKVKALNW